MPDVGRAIEGRESVARAIGWQLIGIGLGVAVGISGEIRVKQIGAVGRELPIVGAAAIRSIAVPRFDDVEIEIDGDGGVAGQASER